MKSGRSSGRFRLNFVLTSLILGAWTSCPPCCARRAAPSSRTTSKTDCSGRGSCRSRTASCWQSSRQRLGPSARTSRPRQPKHQHGIPGKERSTPRSRGKSAPPSLERGRRGHGDNPVDARSRQKRVASTVARWAVRGIGKLSTKKQPGPSRSEGDGQGGCALHRGGAAAGSTSEVCDRQSKAAAVWMWLFEPMHLARVVKDHRAIRRVISAGLDAEKAAFKQNPKGAKPGCLRP